MVEFLAKVALFNRLPRDQLPILASGFKEKRFRKGEDIIKQGEPGREFFVIKDGTASVHISPGTGKPAEQVATLGSGDFFGENALIRNEVRNATIRAETALVTLAISRDMFRQLELHKRLDFPKRKAVGGIQCAITRKRNPACGKNIDKAIVRAAVSGNDNLQEVFLKDAEEWDKLASCVWEEKIAKGKEVITQGSWEADSFYIVKDGSFDVFVDGTKMTTVKACGSFGELALLYQAPRAATVKAVVDSTVYVLDRADFKSILSSHMDKESEVYRTYLDTIEAFKSISADDKKHVAHALSTKRFKRGDNIMEQGKIGDTFYILVDGDVEVLKNGQSVNRLSVKEGSGKLKHFGEISIIKKCPITATIVCRSPEAKCLSIDHTSFGILTHAKTHSKQSTTVARGIKLAELSKVGLLGCGGFGFVELYEHPQTNKAYALKALSKGFIVKTNMKKSVINEKEILLLLSSPFIIKLFATYNKPQQLFFLLEPALGGELFETYNREDLHGSVPHAKFYSAGVVLAFEHMHERKVVYRDLKPENLLLNNEGYLKVTDMGLAKVVPGKTYTTCGTPDYFAPEVIASTGHSLPVDWWTLGILIFELLSGSPPFESEGPMVTMKKIKLGIKTVAFPKECSGDVKDLITGLLAQDPSQRLPMYPGWTKNIKDSKWYKGFDWKGLNSCTLEAPFKPVLKSRTDVANFDARESDKPQQLHYRNDGTGWDKDFATVEETVERGFLARLACCAN
eukprot:TRINITY_DN53935_c0_g1_i1.p1 TRINITY_DN53935_c0_g1~~TRINITY_DN53935_c0_g1_i1.p1  ORF type:complete len:760 (+),score=204.12 TRINITY_DN53935_c0_g1_i1:63-2282(+)